MRRWLSFVAGGENCAATLDDAPGTTGLLIVSGGNELRSGAHRGMAQLAAKIAAAGHPVLRFDRRGVGDSAGENGGFESNAEDIFCALQLFHDEAPNLQRIVAFGNCDAASALILHHDQMGDNSPDALIIANPWTIENDGAGAADGLSEGAAPDDGVGSDGNGGAPKLPPATAIRARYIAKLKDPREWMRLLRGGVNFSKLVHGLRAAGAKGMPAGPTSLPARLATALAGMDAPVTILLASADGTAQAFAAHWRTPVFAQANAMAQVKTVNSASHSFADAIAKPWLEEQLLATLAED
jgi:pimeloyl-ACP methyl ester carboxylesterase